MFITYGSFCDLSTFTTTGPPYSYEARTLGPIIGSVASTTVQSIGLTAFCSAAQCCAIAVCNTPGAAGCGRPSMSVTYTAPDTSTECNYNNAQTATIQSNNLYRAGQTCQNNDGYTMNLLLSNPNQNSLGVFLATGANCINFFDLSLGPNSAFRFISGMESTTATSVALSATCDSPPCCMVVWCRGTTGTGTCPFQRFNLGFSKSPTTLATWAVAVIIVGVCV